MYMNREDDNIMRWHKRLGHLNVTNLKKLYSREIVSGMNLRSNISNISICRVSDMQ